MNDEWECEDELSEYEKRKVEEWMEKRICRQGLIADIIELFVVILIVLAIFFPNALKSICRMISGVTGLIL